MLAKYFPKVQVYGFDRDKEKIEIGKKRYILPNLYLFYSPEIVGQYDSITAILSLHETMTPTQTLNDLYQHLNDDGRILVYEFRKTSLEKYKEWFEKGRPNRVFEEEYRKHNRWSINEFEIMCEKIGFTTIKSEPVGDYWFIHIGQK
jgi:ubiquinone/menaquinone biosynthesis C-methylase UbiE